MTTSTPSYELVCGLEVHAEMKTLSKMFCGCKNDPFYAPAPNTHTCPVCLGMPGALPVANQKAIEWTIKLGLALNCEINLFSKFDRKNYFYPDLPKGYQISQYDIPFCHDGYIETSEGRVRIHRIHLEEDTGKLQHTTLKDRKVSLVDYNRSGVPLIEIVTEADIVSASQAREYGKKLRQIIRYLGIGDCDMEQGGMRLEANISVRPVGTKDLPNYKVEVKNINSFRFLEAAIQYEIERQTPIVQAGETPTQETRGWNPTRNATFSQRSKEEAEDYRYFPDPDIPPIRFTAETIESWRAELPLLPDAVMNAWETEFGIEPRYSELLVTDPATTSEYEKLWTAAKTESVNPNQLASALVNKKTTLAETPAATVAAFKASTATVSLDEDKLTTVITAVLEKFPSERARYKAGETKLSNFFLGQIMRELKAKVDMAQVMAALEKLA